MAIVFNTNWHALLILIKYLETSLSVTVSGPPFKICFSKIGKTEPSELITLPKRTILNILFKLFFLFKYIKTFQKTFEYPIMLFGFTALSVLININFLIFLLIDNFAKLYVTKILF